MSRATTAVPNTTVELVARIEAEWKVFRDAIQRLSREGLDRRIDGAWSYKDMLGHMAAWMEFAPERLHAIRSGDRDPLQWSDEEADRFNARAIAERRLVGAESIVDELDTAYRRVLDEARRATNAEIKGSDHDSGVLSILAWGTYLHWADHHAELGIKIGTQS